MGWDNEGRGRGVAVAARLVAAPLVLALALAALPARLGPRGAPAPTLQARLAAVARAPGGVTVRASLAALFSNPTLGRLMSDELARPDLDPFARDLVRAALTVSRSSSAVAGRLLDTPPTPVDTERLAQLARDLRADPAVARLTAAGATLQRQAWPTQAALDRTCAALARVADRAAAGGGATVDTSDPDARATALVDRVEATPDFASTAGEVARVLDDPGAAGFVRTLPSVVAAGLLDGRALAALGHAGHAGHAGDAARTDAGAAGVRLAAAVVIVASAVAERSPAVVATAITTATTLAGSDPVV